MGNATSTIKSGGTLKGSFVESIRPIDGLKLAEPKMYKLLVPKGSKIGDSITATIAGKKMTFKIPSEGITKGFFFHKYEGEIDKVIASTLPTIPGMEVLQAKPIIWGSVSHAYLHSDSTDGQVCVSLCLVRFITA